MKRWKKLIGGSAGSQVAEAAAIMPLLFLVLMGIYWFGLAYNTYATITRAAQEGARAAAVPCCATCGSSANCPSGPNTLTSPDTVAAAVGRTLMASKLDANQVTPFKPALCACGDLSCSGGTVACGALAGKPNVCVQYNVQLDLPGSGLATCGVAVSFQYPYQFYLPFTSLNLQKITLKAQSQVKGEY